MIYGLVSSLSRPSTSHKVLEITPFETPLDALFSPSRVVFTVPIQCCSNLYLQFYGPGANNPYVETVRDYMEGMHMKYEGSRLYHYYEQCRRDLLNDPFREFTNSLAQLMPSSPGSKGRPLPFPWELTVAGRKQVPEPLELSGQFLYPHKKARENFSRLIRVYESIREKGYRPTSTPDGEIQGFFLKNLGDYRFIVQAGMHRSAVLSAMGYTRIRVTFRPNSFRAIDLIDIENWPQVRGGLYEPSVAERFFLRYFKLIQSHKEVSTCLTA